MFGRQNVFATLKRFAGIRVKDEREKDPNHVVEVEWEAPLTFDLADELSPKLARDLFEDEAGDMVPKREMAEVAPVLSIGRQIMTVRPHPDLEPLGRLSGVEIRKVWITKSEGGTWIVSFLTMFPFEERLVIGLIKHLTLGLYLTFELESPALPFDGKAAAAGEDRDDDGPVKPADQPGDMGVHTNNVVPLKGRRGRPKGSKNRRNPEAEAKAQAQEAAAKGDDDGGDPADV